MNVAALLLLLPGVLAGRARELLAAKSLRCRLGLHPCRQWEACSCYCHMGP